MSWKHISLTAVQQETMSRHAMAERPHREMMEKSHFRETFFSIKNIAQQRPDSVHTEFMETDWDEDDILSELEEDEGSPRLSLDSVSHLMPWHEDFLL